MKRWIKGEGGRRVILFHLLFYFRPQVNPYSPSKFSFLSILYGGLNDSLPCSQHCIIPDLFFSPSMHAAILSSFSNTWKPSQPLFLFKHVPCYSVRSLFFKISILPKTYICKIISPFSYYSLYDFSLKLIVRWKNLGEIIIVSYRNPSPNVTIHETTEES